MKHKTTYYSKSMMKLKNKTKQNTSGQIELATNKKKQTAETKITSASMSSWSHQIKSSYSS